MSSSVFSETLQSITTTKLTELSKKRKVFEDHKASLLAVAQHESDPLTRLRILFDGVKQSFAVKTAIPTKGNRRGGSDQIISGSINDRGLEVMLKNLERFLEQARYDPSISSKLLGDWEQSLTKRLDVQSLKYQYATLYGELVNEWLRAEQASVPPDTSSVNSDGFEEINRVEREESRGEWEKMVFEPFETDQVAIMAYLRSLFGNNGTNKQALKALDALRKSVFSFEGTLSTPGQFNNQVLEWTIKGLLSSSLLSDEKNAVLKDFLASPVILAEVADVLNMRISSFQTWSWGQKYVPVEQRRHVNGAYHIYIDEDLLEAILLQYIGVKWSVFFKEAFTKFSNYDGAWTSLRSPVTTIDKKRREYFLGPQEKKPSVQSKRQGIYKSIFFMSQLPDTPYEQSNAVDGEEEVDYDSRPAKRRTKQTARKASAMPMMQAAAAPMQQQQMQYRMQQSAPQYNMGMATNRVGHPSAHSGGAYYSQYNDEYDEDDEPDKPKSSMETKQFLLHLLSTEILVNTRLHGDFTCTRSEFTSWSPSLPHSTIYSVMSFFGVSSKWLGFFRTFLEAPLKFIEDGASAETRTRKRGVPGAHALSAIFGEAVPFCLDYAVNQCTEGAQLYRMHDDMWLWSPQHATVVKGWEAIVKFSDTMGVTLNEGKTGTVRITRNDKGSTKPGIPDTSLPSGEIRWGFLYLDPATGRFVIDQSMVEHHVDELQKQLQEKNKSVFSWIQAWNTYAGTFFKSNFGKPVNCFGREHVDMVLSTMTSIQKRIFNDSNVVDYLKHTIQTRFGISDIPDGYLYFPTSLGGLELQNPFIGPLQVRNAVFEQPASVLDDFIDAEADAYRRAKITFENGQVQYYSNEDPKFTPQDGNQFMPFEEFTRYREEFACHYEGNLLSVFNELLEKPSPETVDALSKDVEELRTQLWNQSPGADDDYVRWVAQLYGPDMIERFGSLKIVDSGLLPIGMVNLFRSGRVKWQG